MIRSWNLSSLQQSCRKYPTFPFLPGGSQLEEKKSVTRRNFFQQGAVVFGVPALFGLSNSLFAKGAEQLNCGMIGTGGRGRNLLRRIVNSPGVRVSALCDINPQALEAARASKGILQVGQQLCDLPVFRKVMPMLHQGYLGKIGFIRAQRYSNWNGPGSAPR